MQQFAQRAGAVPDARTAGAGDPGHPAQLSPAVVDLGLEQVFTPRSHFRLSLSRSFLDKSEVALEGWGPASDDHAVRAEPTPYPEVETTSSGVRGRLSWPKRHTLGCGDRTPQDVLGDRGAGGYRC